jgi:hypothetical protein
MLSLEDQVCSLEQAKELDGLGVKAESYFVWANKVEQVSINSSFIDKFIIVENNSGMFQWNIAFPAYTCVELGVLLPKKIIYKQDTCYVYHDKNKTGYWPRGYGNCGDCVVSASIKIEAHARAELLIHLLKEKLIKPESLKL